METGLAHYFWDENSVRYHLINSSHPTNITYNWLFFPGGPGADSCYFIDLVKGLNLPGNAWLVDLPNNGSNTIDEQYNYDQWFDLLLPTLNRFQNIIYVGHSFGGMFPLLFPQLESLLQGLVILNSSPILWHEEAAKVAIEKNKPSYMEDLQKFVENPNPETFKLALMACAPYYFPEESLDKGKVMLQQLPFNYHAAGWWQQKSAELNFSATWIPQQVPTLIIGGSEDCMAPPTLFLNDKRFHRENISMITIDNAGHMPWIENIEAVKAGFNALIATLK